MTNDNWKFRPQAEAFHDGIATMLAMNPSAKDLVHHNPVWAGGETLARWAAFFQVMQMTKHLAGHYAEVGTDKGASLLWFAKMFEQTEPRTFVECHGFDWFGGKGMSPTANESGIKAGSYAADDVVLRKLIDIQNLGHVAKLHKIDATTELGPWFEANPTPLKIALMDAGTITEPCIPVLWDNLISGGVLILDHFGDARVPGEIAAVRKHLPGVQVQAFGYTRHPAAYAVKS